MRKKLLTSGNTFKRTDGRWNGVVWYLDEQGERKRKSFSGISRQEVREKITTYIANALCGQERGYYSPLSFLTFSDSIRLSDKSVFTGDKRCF